VLARAVCLLRVVGLEYDVAGVKSAGAGEHGVNVKPYILRVKRFFFHSCGKVDRFGTQGRKFAPREEEEKAKKKKQKKKKKKKKKKKRHMNAHACARARAE
jgi:hypothetical protein